MSLPPTLIIANEDEDRTQVDHLPRRRRPIAASRRWSRHLRAYGGFLTALALVLVSGSVVFHHWQAVEKLESAVAALEASRVAFPVSPPREFEIGGASSPPVDQAPDVFAREVDEAKRAALELEGASLLASNDFPRARIHYARLVSLFPDEPVFREVLTLLGTKL